MVEVDKTEFKKAQQMLDRNNHKSKTFLGKRLFEFYELDPRSYPEIHQFVLSLIYKRDYLIGISRAVPEHFRPYWAVHEYIKNVELNGLEDGRGLAALETELSLVPEEWRSFYLPQRGDYFTNLVEYCLKFPEAYPPETILGFQKNRDRLEELVKQNSQKGSLSKSNGTRE